jgi:hypothetical protein
MEPPKRINRGGSTSFFGTPKHFALRMHARLTGMMSDSMRRSLRWPNALSNALRRMAADLRAAGIEIQFSRANIQGRSVLSMVSASEPRKRSSVIFRDRQ